MRRSHKFSFVLMLFGAIALTAGSAAAQTVTVGALPQGSMSYTIAAAVAKIIGDHSGFDTRAIGVGGTNIYFPQVDQGQLTMCTAVVPEAVFAVNGTGSYEGRKHPNLRVLARILEFQGGFMVRKDSDIHSLADFKGKPFPTGYTSQKIINYFIRGAFASEGLSYDDVKGVPVPNFVRGTDELVAGKVVGSFLTPGSGIVQKANASIGIRFISLKADPKTLKKLQDIAPGAYFAAVQPAKQMPYITEPVNVLAYDYLILVGAGVSDDIAYKSAKALHQNKAALVAAHGVFRGFDPKLIAKQGLGVEYHPGAMKYYKEAGLR